MKVNTGVCAVLALLLAGGASAAGPAAKALACPKGTLYVGQLNAKNNLPPSSKASKSTGVFQGCLNGRSTAWQLSLCDVTGFTASHLHIGSTTQSYKLPTLKIAPMGAAASFAPPKNIKGCTYTLKGTFTPASIIPTPPDATAGLPGASNWDQFVALLKKGSIYANVHTVAAPAGVIRGNLYKSK